MESGERGMLGVRAAELLRSYIQQLPPPRVLFEGPKDPMHHAYKELRAIPVSPWAGPKAVVGEVECASLEPDGLPSKVFVVAGNEDGVFNCLEAVPEC
eukprot:10421123-Alexandrium_andersonii.AAC.1